MSDQYLWMGGCVVASSNGSTLMVSGAGVTTRMPMSILRRTCSGFSCSKRVVCAHGPMMTHSTIKDSGNAADTAIKR